MKKTIISIAVAALAANLAVARDNDRDDRHRCHGEARWCVSAPEIDPGEAMGALALLSGTIAIIRGYRRRKK